MSVQFILPEGYHSSLSLRDTESAIKLIKDYFEAQLAGALRLQRVSAPLFVRPESGLNDNLNGSERPVSFDVPCVGSEVEIVHSLAKWKRMALKRYGFEAGYGLYTDMNAIRRDEEADNLHSIYVDQWDWEKVIEKSQRNMTTLKETVEIIYGVMRKTQQYVCDRYPSVKNHMPEKITFVTAQELEDQYPDLTPKERENAAAKEHGAIFVIGIGDKLKSGERHDGRAPDYDDWTLNGDILCWFPLLECAFELSSMGIRVDETALCTQLEKAGCKERMELDFHKQLLEGKLPYTIGGGIGQSRLCMYMLSKAHIGEVQASIWPEEMAAQCAAHRINLL